jgi:hypothetical protein
VASLPLLSVAEHAFSRCRQSMSQALLGMVTPDATHLEVRQLGVIHPPPIVAPLQLITVNALHRLRAVQGILGLADKHTPARLDAQGREMLHKVLVAGS